MLSKTKTHGVSDDFKMFANVRVLVVTALFIAMSIVLGKFLSITAGPVRISFENLTVLMSGFMFGPVVGLVTGAVADIIGCILYGYAINPIITVGAALIGFVSGFVSHYMLKNKPLLRTALSVGLAHLIGSVIVKSIGMYIYFGYTLPMLAIRIPLYIGIGLVEFYIIYMLMKNKSFIKQMDKVCRR